MKRQMYDDESSDSPAWIMVFADLMTLLLVFFILLFSMSTIEIKRFETAMISIQSSLGSGNSVFLEASGERLVPAIAPYPDTRSEIKPEVVDTEPEAPQQSGQNIITQPSIGDNGEDWREIAQTLRSRISRQDLREIVKVNMPRDGMIAIEIEGAVLFDSGSVYLNSEVDPVLDTLKQTFRQYDGYTINIMGHTDNIPISTPQFESNWELSAIRATTLLRHFVNQGMNPKRFTATGYGSSMPIADNDTPEGRSKNRRIEIVLERTEGRTFP